MRQPTAWRVGRAPFRVALQSTHSVIRNGRAEGLLVAKLDRLSRSLLDGAGLMEQAASEGWVLHFADLNIGTSTPAGEMAANMIIIASSQ